MEVMNCTVRRQVLNIDAPTLVALSYDCINVKATFSSEWDGMQKCLHIRNVADQTLVGHILFENDEIGEDKGLNLSAGEWDVWIHGAKYEDNTLIKRITTDVKKIKVEATGSEDEILPDVGPSVAEQAVAAAERAEAAADSAEQSATGASESADDAVAAANSAEQSATNAATSESNAQTYANRAEQAVSRYPYINTNGNWMVYNVNDSEFVDTGVNAHGSTFYPHVNDEGTLSWTNDAGLPNPDPVNLIDLFVSSSPELQATVDAILAEAEAGVADIAEQRDTILASIAAAAELGTDTTLTVAGMAADAKATGTAVRELKSAATKYGSYPFTDDIVVRTSSPSTTGISFMWDGNVCRASGTTSSANAHTMINQANIPSYIKRGRLYPVKYKTTNPLVLLSIIIHKSDNTAQYLRYTNDGYIVFPENAIKYSLRLYVDAGTTIPTDDPAVISEYSILSDMPNEYLYDTQSGDVFPSMFKSSTNNTDCKMIQAAVDYAFTHKVNVCFEREYVLNSGETVFLDKYTGGSYAPSDRFVTRFYGVGKYDPSLSGTNPCGITKNYSGLVFSAHANNRYSGDFVFDNLSFNSSSGAGCCVFSFAALIRTRIENCFFRNVDTVACNDAYASIDRTKYWQDVTIKSCSIVGGKGYAIYGTGVFSVRLEDLLIEHRDGGIKFSPSTIKYSSIVPGDVYYRCRNLIIRNCLIEGISGTNLTSFNDDGTPSCGAAIWIDNPYGVEITGCYLEANYKNIVLGVSAENIFKANCEAIVRSCWTDGPYTVNRYGTETVYQDILDDTCIVTINADYGVYHIEDNCTFKGGVVSAPASVDSNNLTIIYNANGKVIPTYSDAKVYGSFAYDSSKGVWIGSNKQADGSIITGGNKNESSCLTYQLVALT